VEIILVEKIEKWCLQKASCIFVTTREIKDRYCDKYQLPTSKIMVIPNFIDTSIFYPIPEIKAVKGRICFVGRLEPIIKY
jgi:glycosyltransferase involved in cell wall biosynthesis